MATPEALIEIWTLYAFGSLFIFLRVFSRTKLVGIRGYRLDDYLVWFAWVAYTWMTVAAHIVGQTSDTSHLTMEERLAMTREQRKLRSLGSKWSMVGWYTYITLIWTLKFNMLCFYQRVVGGVWVRKFIKPTMGLVAVSGLAIYILFAVSCRPFHKLWQVLPAPGANCYPQNPAFLIIVLVLNLTTDLCIMAIPTPVIIPLKTSIPRKIGLLLLFGGGTFVMMAAVLRVYYVLAQGVGQTSAIWSCREDIIAILVGQATMIRSLCTKRFWTGQASSSSEPHPPKACQGSGGVKLSVQPQKVASRLGFTKLSKPKDPYNVSVLETRNYSEEHIFENDGSTYTPFDKRHETWAQTVVASFDGTGTTECSQHRANIERTVDVESIGDNEVGDVEEQKLNYGHTNREPSSWNAF
ncbi:hypothetical protein H2198_001855 [Neophaeococcomyces mojaviensis]|uniref:Uncharacterized protein n=1 Tax=Neophaeococcomyces mojaviensis TaxID=3383035 RepID=A0ACC3AGF0_9EURO|nr:hypothetical protein H2198_001855 [Knufia sp. JES_112]